MAKQKKYYGSKWEKILWESFHEKLLWLNIDENVTFENHLKNFCEKVSAKISALARLKTILPFDKKRILLKSFIESQFSYCPLIWMFCSRKMDRKINHIHERALRIVYDDYNTSFDDLLVKDKSVTIHQRNIRKVAIEMFKVKNNLCPEFMQEFFNLIPCRNRSKASFHRPNVNQVYKGECTIRSFGPIDLFVNYVTLHPKSEKV